MVEDKYQGLYRRGVNQAIPEVRAKQESATPDSNYTLGVYDRITAPSWKLKICSYRY